MSSHTRPASFDTIRHDNIPAGTPISFKLANLAGDDSVEVRGTLDKAMLIARDETGRVMPIEDVSLLDANGWRFIALDRILDFQTLEDEEN